MTGRADADIARIGPPIYSIANGPAGFSAFAAGPQFAGFHRDTQQFL